MPTGVYVRTAAVREQMRARMLGKKRALSRAKTPEDVLASQLMELQRRDKISAFHKGRKRTPETCANISAAKKGFRHSAETRAKLTGRRHSAEARAKMSAAKKGRPRGPTPAETRAKISAAQAGSKNHHWKGNAVSEQGSRARAQRMYPVPLTCPLCGQEPVERHHADGNPRNNTPENIVFACHSCHMKMHSHSEAARRKMSLASHAYWAKKRSQAVEKD